MDIRIARSMSDGHLVAALRTAPMTPIVELLCERLEARVPRQHEIWSEFEKAREALRAVEINQQY